MATKYGKVTSLQLLAVNHFSVVGTSSQISHEHQYYGSGTKSDEAQRLNSAKFPAKQLSNARRTGSLQGVQILRQLPNIPENFLFSEELKRGTDVTSQEQEYSL